MSVGFPESLKDILAGRTLDVDRARRALGFVVDGGASLAQAGAFVGALAMRGPTVAEIVGFSQAVRERCVKVKVGRAPLLETCGTCAFGVGAPGAGNVSTTVAFIAAGAGVAVAHQVCRAVAGRCGSADLLEALGIRVDIAPQVAARCVEEAGAGFFLSSVYHPALKSVLPLRGELGVRTVFDLLEPLANPVAARWQLLGVYATGLVPMLARALKSLGSESVMVVSSRDGLDEFSLAAPSVVAHLRGDRIEEYEVDAAALGLKRCRTTDLAGGDVVDNAKILLSILKGERSQAFDVALLNAAAALIVAGRAVDFKEGLAMAAESVDNCRAAKALETVKKLSLS